MTEALERCVATGKAVRTKSQNDLWLGEYRARKVPGAPKLRGYQCEHCGGWHVTHIQSKTVKRRLSKRARRSM